jgi:DNA-binding GntR family transcriptional regulator
VRTATPADVAALRELVAAMDDLDAAAWSDRNFTFHQELHRLSEMPHFADVTGRVLTMIEPYSRVAVTVLQEQSEAQAEHHQMIDALAAQDADELARLLLHHSHRARKALLAYAAQTAKPVDPQVVATAAARSLADHLSA